MLTDEMLHAIESCELFPFATASWESYPNVVPVKYLGALDRERLWITDNYLSKTLGNLDENPYGAVYLMASDRRGCWQIKGRTSLHKDGPMFEAMKDRVLQANRSLPARSLVILEIDEIFECMPGDGAGQLIWKSERSTFRPT